MWREVLRGEYRQNPEFKRSVDEELSPEAISRSLDWLRRRLDDDGTRSYELCMTLLDCLGDLLDQDFVLTLKDRLQAPLYKSYTEKEFVHMLLRSGFTSWYRISRKPVYYNIRRIFSPLYHEYAAPLARLLYGEGTLIVMAKK